jgi:hypothetical protein
MAKKKAPDPGAEQSLPRNPFYDALKANTHRYSAKEFAALLRRVDKKRYQRLAKELSDYIGPNLLQAVKKRGGLAKYRTNPYVLMASASAMSLSDPMRLADFIFNNKLYAGLETSFGKSIERLFVGEYPIDGTAEHRWIDPPEKEAEAAGLQGLSRQEKARRRIKSIWREIDKSCVQGRRRFLVSIKSGPNCINDTQVQGMTDAIAQRHAEWLRASQVTYPDVTELDVIIGITYGTDRTTNNKENQILVKLLEHGFTEEDRVNKPGVLIDPSRTVRVYRCVGQDFWAVIGNPASPAAARFVFVETLLAAAKGLSTGLQVVKLTDEINLKLAQLSTAFARLVFPHEDLPKWAKGELSQDELFWLATALTAFYDQGI